MKSDSIHTIVTHKCPHSDEAFAIWELSKWGDKRFPGVVEAIERGKVLFVGTGGEGYNGVSGDEFKEAGFLFVGSGGGILDEHPGVHLQGKEDDCAATLVAKELGIDKDPALQRILRYILHNDKYGGANYLDVADGMRKMHRAYPDKDMQVTRWTFPLFEAEYESQLRFFRAKEEFHEKAQVERFEGLGRTIVMAVFESKDPESDNPEINAVARSEEHGVGADVVIQKHSSGHVQIHTNTKRKLILDDLARMLRQEEQKIREVFETTDWRELSQEGKAAGVPEWYYDRPARRLLNGALSAPETPVTQIPLEQIVGFTRIALEIGYFEPSHASECKKGICTTVIASPCPWCEYGLHRCRQIRYKMSQS